LLLKISEEIACWEKVALVVYIKDAWRTDRFANSCSLCFNFVACSFGYAFTKKYRDHSLDLLIGSDTFVFRAQFGPCHLDRLSL
jgi:hypothetical protein